MTGRRFLASCTLSIVVTAMPACAPTFTERMPAVLVRRTQPVSMAPIVVAPAQDLRPQALKSSHDPVRSRVFAAYWLIGGHYQSTYEGPLVYGDRHTHLTTSADPGKQLSPMEALDAYLPLVLRAGTGRDVAVAAAGMDAMKAPARLLPGGRGFVIVPVVDQMDVCKLSSERFHQDVSIDFQVERKEAWSLPSYPRGNVVAVVPAMPASQWGPRYEISTTSSGSTDESTRDTSVIGNVRVRLLLFQIAGGRVVARSTVYAAGASNGLSAAMAAAGSRMAVGVGEFLSRSVASQGAH